MLDAQRLDPALLAECNADEVPELHQFRFGEVLMQPGPERAVGFFGRPDDGACPGKRDFFPLGKFVGVVELEQGKILLLGQPSLSGPDRTLVPSIVALDRLRDVNAAQLLDLVVANAVAEDSFPSPGEGP